MFTDPWRVPARVLGAAALLAALPAGAQVVPEPVQGVTVLREGPERCAGCTITRTLDVVLESAGQEFGGLGRGILFRDSRGRFFHLNGFVQSAFLVFDAEGRFIQGVERSGQGPGEFAMIGRIVIGRGDTLHVLDRPNARMTTLAPDLGFVRSARVGLRQWDAVEMRPGLIMLSGDNRTPDRFGYPLHPIRDGVPGRPMGGTEALVDSHRPEGREVARTLLRVSDTTFWAAHVSRYRFELWRTDDVLLRVLTGDPGWFEVAEHGTLEGMMDPLILDMELDEHGLLWVLVWVRTLDWDDLAVEGPQVLEDLPNLQSRTGDPFDLRDAVIQVIDPEAGAILATRRFSSPFRSFAGPRRVYTYEESGAGEPRVTMWKLELSEPPTPSR